MATRSDQGVILVRSAYRTTGVPSWSKQGSVYICCHMNAGGSNTITAEDDAVAGSEVFLVSLLVVLTQRQRPSTGNIVAKPPTLGYALFCPQGGGAEGKRCRL